MLNFTQTEIKQAYHSTKSLGFCKKSSLYWIGGDLDLSKSWKCGYLEDRLVSRSWGVDEKVLFWLWPPKSLETGFCLSALFKIGALSTGKGNCDVN